MSKDYGKEAADGQHSIINQNREEENAENFRRTDHPDAQWFGEAGLGQFIHWDIASVISTDMGWSMIDNKPWGKAKIKPVDYFALAQDFKPTSFNPDEFIKASAEAGFKYAVITTKHHCGYTLWPSKFGDFGVHKFLPGEDYVGPFVEACRKYGLKVGLYYSPPDWYFNQDYMSFNFQSGTEKYPDRPHMDKYHNVIDELQEMPDDHEKAYHELIRGQVKELLTNYGHVDILWFDGGPACMTFEEIRAMQPHIIINDRMHGYGDMYTPENHHPENKPTGWWERVDRWNAGAWGYTSPLYLKTDWMLDCLAQARSWGGNFMPNTTPDRTGAMSDEYYVRMYELKRWMHHSAESLFGVEAGPWPEKCSVPVTVNDNVWYVHFKEDVEEAILTGKDKPSGVSLLRTGEKLEYETANGKTILKIPPYMRTRIDDVVKVEW